MIENIRELFGHDINNIDTSDGFLPFKATMKKRMAGTFDALAPKQKSP
jgi:hypothetical protein